PSVRRLLRTSPDVPAVAVSPPAPRSERQVLVMVGSAANLLEVVSLNGLKHSCRGLLASNQLLQVWRPAVGVDGPGRVSDKVHCAVVLAYKSTCSKSLRRDGVRVDLWHKGVCWAHGVRAADLNRNGAGLVVGGNPVKEVRRAVRVRRVCGDSIGERCGHGAKLAALFERRHQEEACLSWHLGVEVA